MVDKGIVTPIAYSRTLTYVALYALLVGVYAVLPVLKEHSVYEAVADLPPQIHAALTLVLGWLLVLRTNTAHARWWEARTLWGGLVNACRNVAVKTSCLGKISLADQETLRRLLVAYPPLLRDHLRDEVEQKSADSLLQSVEASQHPPSELVRRIYAQLDRCRTTGEIDGDVLRVIDVDLSQLLNICGGCERIKSTRMIRSYRVFVRQCIFLFLATFPWGISNDFGWWTIPLTIITAYFMLGLETVAEHVEEPFGYDDDDLDLDRLCNVIETSVNEIYGRQKDSPAPAT